MGEPRQEEIEKVGRSMSAGLASAKARAFLADETAAAAIEFTLLAPIFFAVLLTIFAVGAIELSRAQLDHASEIGKRAVLTGQATDSAALRTAIQASIGGLIDPANLIINLTPYSSLSNMNTSSPTLRYDQNGNVANSWQTQFGNTGSIMVLQLVYQFPIVGAMYSLATQQNGNFLLVSTQVFVRE